MASNALRLVNGIPRMQTIITAGISVTYDEAVTAPIGGFPDGTLVSLPNSETYDSVELKVFLNGSFLEPTIDYDYVSTPPRSQIEILRADIVEGDRIRFVKQGDLSVVYDQVIEVPNGGYAPGQNVTLPLGRTYIDVELQVYLDGQFLEPGEDYIYIGSAPRTQIQLIPELFETERLRFRIEI